MSRFSSFFLKTISFVAILMVFFMQMNPMPVFAADVWTTKASMAQVRSWHTSILQTNGKILVIGGSNTSMVEEYNPITNVWTTKASMAQVRSWHTSILQTNGKILVMGGSNTNTVEEYDPVIDTWTLKTPMNEARSLHTSILQSNGKILVMGGSNTNTVEEYDPVIDTWTLKTPMNEARSLHTSILQSNGKILVIGGRNTTYPRAIEEYDPITNTWTTKASMAEGRYAHTATLESNGKILVMGGLGGSEDTSIILDSVEEYNPMTNTWTTKASLLPGWKYGHTATLESNGKILVIGGYGFTGVPGTFLRGLNSVEEYDPTTNAWTTKVSMSEARVLHTSILQANGKILVIWGASVEEFTPENNQIPLTLLSSTPANSSTWVVTNPIIALNFSKPLDGATIPGNIFLERTGLESVPLNLVNTSGSIVSFRPSVPLNKNTSYTVQLKTGLKDTEGNNLVSDSSFSFTTIPEYPPTSLLQQIRSPQMEIEEVNLWEKIWRHQSGSGIILSAISNNPWDNTRLDFEVYKVWGTTPSYVSHSWSWEVIIPFFWAWEYSWRARSADELWNASEWVDFWTDNPQETDYAVYEWFEPYPYGYRFANSTPDPLILNWWVGYYIDTTFPYHHLDFIPGNKWNMFNNAFDTSPGSWFEPWSIKALLAFETMWLNDEMVFQWGNCYGMASSAAMWRTYPDYLRNYFPEFSLKIWMWNIWDSIASPGSISQWIWDTYDKTLDTILTFQLSQSSSHQMDIIDDWLSEPQEIINELNNNPNNTYLLLFYWKDSKGKTSWHAVVPYKVEWNKIFVWDNNIPYPYILLDNWAKEFWYNQYIKINSDSTWEAPLYNWKKYDKLFLVKMNDTYNWWNKSVPAWFMWINSLYTLSGHSDLLITDSQWRISGFSWWTVLEEIPGIDVITPLNATLDWTPENTWKQIYLPKKIDWLSIKVNWKTSENYNLMIAWWDYYTKVSGVSTGTWQTDKYISTGTWLSIDFDDTKTWSYNLMANNFQDTFTGMVFLSGITSISQPQKYMYDWTKVLQSSTNAISYQVDADNDGVYDISSTFSAVPIDEKWSISWYLEWDKNASMAGWKVFIDKNGDWKLEESSEIFTVTDNKWYYKFANLNKWSYSILEIPRQNWIMKKPQSRKYNIILNNWQNIVNLNFENSFTKGKNK